MKAPLIPFAAALLTACLMIPSLSDASPRLYLKDQIEKLAEQTAQFRREIDTHYRQSKAYRHLVADARAINLTIDDLDEFVNQDRQDIGHVYAQVAELDRRIGHLLWLIDAIERGEYGRFGQPTDHGSELAYQMKETASRIRGFAASSAGVPDRGDYDSNYYR